MKRVFLLAHPAGHSLSPAMHNAGFAALGIEARYEALDVPPAELAAAVARLREPAVLGANVTIPHKQAVLPLLDGPSEAARAIGAVNTIVHRGGRLEGHNTDASGFLRALAELGVAPAGARALLLGAGGAARAVGYALLREGAAELAIFNRTSERARALAEALGSFGPVRALAAGELAEAVATAGLVVNTTSVGMVGPLVGASPLPPGLLPRRGAVVDIVYRPPETRLLREAAAAGLATQNGLPMLLFQGAEAFRLWAGREAPLEVMRSALRQALAE